MLNSINLIVHFSFLFFLLFATFYLVKLKKSLELAKMILDYNKRTYKIINPRFFFKEICMLTNIKYTQSVLLPKNFYKKIKTQAFLNLITTQPIQKLHLKSYLNKKNHDTIELEITIKSALKHKRQLEEILSKELNFKINLIQEF